MWEFEFELLPDAEDYEGIKTTDGSIFWHRIAG